MAGGSGGLRNPRVAEKPKSSAPSEPPAAEKAAAPMPPPPAVRPKVPPPPVKWRSSWQVPALAGAVLLLAGGIVTALMTAPKPNFEKLFEQAQEQIGHNEFELARQ